MTILDKKYYAEDGVDKTIRENFFPNINEKKIMVEVGAGPIEFYSVSKHFRESGWRCICVEPNPKFVEQHKKVGNEIYQFACSDKEKESKFTIIETSWDSEKNGISYSSLGLRYPINEKFTEKELYVKVIKLNTLLENLKIEKVDFLSIDTEGWEIEVMKGFDCQKYSPEIILLENFLHNTFYVDYMKSLNYELAYKVKYNYIFKKI